MGLLFVHIGVVVLILSEILTAKWSIESHLILKKNEPVNYSRRAVSRLNIYDLTSSTSSSYLSSSLHRDISIGSDYSIQIKKKHLNCETFRSPQSPVDHGIGVGFDIKNNDQSMLSGLIVEIVKLGRSYGTWLLTTADSDVQYFDNFGFELINQHLYYPYQFVLRECRRIDHPGTNIPAHYESQIDVIRQDVCIRSATISMNQPFVFDGKTFYQSSMDIDADVSILQIVQNPSKYVPYLALVFIALGMIIHVFEKKYGTKQ